MLGFCLNLEFFTLEAAAKFYMHIVYLNMQITWDYYSDYFIYPYFYILKFLHAQTSTTRGTALFKYTEN